jgi:hypothetical protein
MTDNVTFDGGIKPVWSVWHSGGHTYRWAVEFNGATEYAFLTYGLLRPRDWYRRILAVEVQQPERIKAWLNDEDYKSVNLLENLLLEKRKTGLGKTGAAKALALDIHEGKLNLPRVDVAVHKYGAVPVYLIPEATVSLKIFGQQRDCGIGIFISGRERKSAEEDQEDHRGRPVNSLELLRSLRIRPDLTFIRYMEDVGEYAHDLRTRRNWSYVFRYGRKMEELLNASVGSKVKTVLRYAAPKNMRGSEILLAAQDEARRYLADYRVPLYKYSAARAIYLFTLNHLYRAVGMKDKCDHYDCEYQDGWRKFFFSVAERHECLDTDPELGALDAVWKAWHAADAEQELALLQRDSRSLVHWLQRLVDFACFTSHLHHLKTDPGTTKVFFSSRHIESMSQTREEVAKLFNRHLPDQAALLYVESLRPGFPFADQIPPQIWLSDALFSVYSPRTDSDLKDRDWVSHEVALAKSFRLPCMIVRESTVTLEEIYARLCKEKVDQAEHPVNTETVPALPDDSSERMRFLEPHLLETGRQGAKKKCETLLSGFLINFFTKEHVWIIARTHLACFEPGIFRLQGEENTEIGWIRIPELASILGMKAGSLFDALGEICGKERALSFATSGVEIPPLVMNPEKTHCKGNLLAAMEVLRPDLIGYEKGEVELQNHLVQIMKSLV